MPIVISGAIDPATIGDYDAATGRLVVHDDLEIHGGFTFTRTVNILDPDITSTRNIRTIGNVTISFSLGSASKAWGNVTIG